MRKDGSLLSAQAFTSLSLIALLTAPLLTLCQAMPSLLEGVSCFERIEAYCLKSHVPLPDSAGLTPSLDQFANHAIELEPPTRGPLPHIPLVSFSNANISWSLDSEIVLRDLNLSVWTGITMIIGPVGSGKSALIESILGETELRSGSMASRLSRVAYCSQSPWIMNKTIRDNIIWESEFDQKWYEFTIAACGLDEDLKKIPGGDACKAGSNGVSLSGGQKQRVVSRLLLSS